MSQLAGPKPNPIITTCRDCIFAEYSGNEQVDCDWNRLEKFEENGAEIVGQDDGDKRYFLVVGRFCNACRHQEWGKQHPPKDWHGIVAKEFAVRCCFLIYVDDSASVDEVRMSLESVLEQRPSASRVVILLNAPSQDVRPYLRLVKEMGVNIPWEIKSLITEEQGVPVEYGKAVDIGLQHVKDETYYTLGGAGYFWRYNYLQVINDAINGNMKRIIAVLPDEEDGGGPGGLLMSVALHNRLLQGNVGQPVLEKVRQVAEAEGTGHMIKTWGELRASAE